MLQADLWKQNEKDIVVIIKMKCKMTKRKKKDINNFLKTKKSLYI